MAGKISLSARLKAAADMVTSGNRVCDVGCDHGYLSIYLIEQGISPKVLAMDVREGPLGHAKEHVLGAGLQDYITLRLSDGLTGFEEGEAQTLVCAGMGGRLIRKILCREPFKTKSFRELILQPQSETAALRRFLREQGYSVIWEDMIWEEGKFYPLIKAVPDKKVSGVQRADGRMRDEEGSPVQENEDRLELEERFGPILLERKHPVLLAFLERERESAGRLKALLEEAKESEKAAERLEELKKEIRYIEQARELCR